MTPERQPKLSVVGVTMAQVEEGRRTELREQLMRYLVELDEITAVAAEAADGGEIAYPWFDLYWSEPSRLPFLIEDGKTVVGFALIRAIDAEWNIAEFGVDRKMRRKGVGRAAVVALANLARHAGADHLRADVHRSNTSALSFWRACGFLPAAPLTSSDADVISTRRDLLSGR